MPTEENREKYSVGTVIEDGNKLAVITKIIQSGAMNTDVVAIKWRLNYEICYIDGDIQIIGEKTLDKLIRVGHIKIIIEG